MVHLIFNMWFLWLAGFVLEDVWGRPLYLVFYLLAVLRRRSFTLGRIRAASAHRWGRRGLLRD